MKSQPTEIYEVAVASPFYFIPKGFNRPTPAKANVTLHVTDENDKPLSAMVSVMDAGKEIAQQVVDKSGTAVFSTPATAYLIIKAPGFTESKKDLFIDSPIWNYCRNFNGFYNPGSFNAVRSMLGRLSFDVKLTRSSEIQ